MDLLKKIILTFTSTSLILFFIYVIFIVPSNTYNPNILYIQNEKGDYILNKNKISKKYHIKKHLDIEYNNPTFIKKIGLSNNIIYNTINSVNISKNNIELGKGIFILDLREYSIHSNIIINGAIIKNTGPGLFVINSIEPDNTLIYSINSILNIDLINLKTNKSISQINLYPNSYLILDSSMNKFLKKSDLLKISQIHTMGYFNEIIFKDSNNINDQFLKLISLNDSKQNEFIKSSIGYIQQCYINNKKTILNFTSKKINNINFDNIIEKYFLYLINDEKRIIFLKNIAIQKINKLLKTTKKNTPIVNSLHTTIQNIKSLSTKDANDIINILSYFYDLSFKTDTDKFMKMNLTNIFNKINTNNQNNKIANSLYYSENIFFKYNFGHNINFYNELNSFYDEHIQDTKIVNENGIFDKDIILSSNTVNYLLYFLKNILLSDYKENNNSDLITLFKNYTLLSNNYYKLQNDKVKKTGIFINIKVLQNLNNIIRNKYFLKDRDKDNLLLINEKYKTSKDITNITNLEISIKSLINFYKDYKTMFSMNSDGKDNATIRLYDEIEKGKNIKNSRLNLTYGGFNELFFALLKNKEYIDKYNPIIVKNECSLAEDLKGLCDTNILSIKKAQQYLDQFSGIYFKDTEITLMDNSYCQNPYLNKDELYKLHTNINTCYKIDNLYVGNNVLSFILYPLQDNKIDYIKIGNDTISSSYILNDIKNIWEQKRKEIPIEDRGEQFQFRKFLLISFGEKISDKNSCNNNEVFQNGKCIKMIVCQDNEILKNGKCIKQCSELTEKDAIWKFKTNEILGDKGDFSIVYDNFEFKYNDICIERKQDNLLDIYVNPTKFRFINDNSNEFTGFFESKYNFDIHSFIEPSITLYNMKKKKQLLLGKSIQISGLYYIGDIKTQMLSMLSHTNNINNIIHIIHKKLKSDDFVIFYNKIYETFIIQLKNKTFELQYKNGHIIKLEYKSNTLINKPVLFKENSTIFNNIK